MVTFKIRVRDWTNGNLISGATVTLYANGVNIGTKTTDANGETGWYSAPADSWITGTVTKSGYKTTNIEGFRLDSSYDGIAITVYMEPGESPPTPPPTKVQFRIRVVDEDTGTGIAGASVMLQANGTYVGTQTTDSSGYTGWWGVDENASCLVSITASGYATQQKTFTASRVIDGSTVILSITSSILKFRFYVKDYDTDNPISGVTIKVYANGSYVGTYTTGSTGFTPFIEVDRSTPNISGTAEKTGYNTYTFSFDARQYNNQSYVILLMARKIQFKIKVRDWNTGNVISGASVTIYADGNNLGTKTTDANGETDWFTARVNAYITGTVTASGYKTTSITGFYLNETYDNKAITVYMELVSPPYPYPKFVNAYILYNGAPYYPGETVDVAVGDSIEAIARVKNEGESGTVYFWVYDANTNQILKSTSKTMAKNETSDLSISLTLATGSYRLSLRVGNTLGNSTDSRGG
ncbi:MAG: hypothetical protein QW540_08045 [Archaeoglobaceae archaeon]